METRYIGPRWVLAHIKISRESIRHSGVPGRCSFGRPHGIAGGSRYAGRGKCGATRRPMASKDWLKGTGSGVVRPCLCSGVSGGGQSKHVFCRLSIVGAVLNKYWIARQRDLHFLVRGRVALYFPNSALQLSQSCSTRDRAMRDIAHIHVVQAVFQFRHVVRFRDGCTIPLAGINHSYCGNMPLSCEPVEGNGGKLDQRPSLLLSEIAHDRRCWYFGMFRTDGFAALPEHLGQDSSLRVSFEVPPEVDMTGCFVNGGVGVGFGPRELISPSPGGASNGLRPPRGLRSGPPQQTPKPYPSSGCAEAARHWRIGGRPTLLEMCVPAVRLRDLLDEYVPEAMLLRKVGPSKLAKNV